LGYRECGVADAERLTAWLAEHVTHAERSPERGELTTADLDRHSRINAKVEPCKRLEI